jgi:hypothetical protein
VADKGKHGGILAYFERTVKKKMNKKFTAEAAESMGTRRHRKKVKREKV